MRNSVYLKLVAILVLSTITSLVFSNAASASINVRYNKNVPANSQQVQFGCVTILDSMFSRPGYLFNGWNRSSDGSGDAYAPGDSCASLPDAMTNLYAQWVSVSTVVFNSNGGSGSMSDQSAGVTTPLTSNAFTRDGYEFLDWNTAADGSGTYYDDEDSYDFTSNLTLYAQWGFLTTVTFERNGGTSGSMWPQTSSLRANLRANTFTRSGFLFAGWSTDVNGCGTKFSNRSYYDFSADITLYAQWRSNSGYTVTFDSNGGSGCMSNQSSSVSAALSSNTFTRNGYTFSGWTSNADGSGTSYADSGTYSFASGMTVYAKWTAASSDSGQGESDAATVAAASAKEVEEARARAVTEAKSEVKSVLTAGKPLTVDQLLNADFVGVTPKNIDLVNTDIAKLPESQRGDLKQIEKVVLKFATVDKVAEGKSYYSSDLIAVGLIPQDSKSKTLILTSLKKLPQSSLDSFEKIQQAIASVEKVAADRKARLTALLARRR